MEREDQVLKTIARLRGEVQLSNGDDAGGHSEGFFHAVGHHLKDMWHDYHAGFEEGKKGDVFSDRLMAAPPPGTKHPNFWRHGRKLSADSILWPALRKDYKYLDRGEKPGTPEYEKRQADYADYKKRHPHGSSSDSDWNQWNYGALSQNSNPSGDEAKHHGFLHAIGENLGDMHHDFHEGWKVGRANDVFENRAAGQPPEGTKHPHMWNAGQYFGGVIHGGFKYGYAEEKPGTPQYKKRQDYIAAHKNDPPDDDDGHTWGDGSQPWETGG